MEIKSRKRSYVILAVIAIIAVGSAVGALSVSTSADVPPGTIDDGAELLPQANITLEEAIAAAQEAASGALGEVDLEYYEGRLVFNVDIGDKDVKVDASNGDTLGWIQDD